MCGDSSSSAHCALVLRVSHVTRAVTEEVGPGDSIHMPMHVRMLVMQACSPIVSVGDATNALTRTVAPWEAQSLRSERRGRCSCPTRLTQTLARDDMREAEADSAA